MNGLRQVTSGSEEISDHGVYREEVLGLAWRFEAAHLSLPLPRGLVRELGAVVGIRLRVVHRRRHRLALGRRVASELVGDEPARRATLTLQLLAEESGGRAAVPPTLGSWTRNGSGGGTGSSATRTIC